MGVDVNTPLLEKIAYESRATTTFILPGEDVEVKVAAVFQRLAGPVLADPKLTIGDEGTHSTRARELIPSRLPDVFEGDQIVLLASTPARSRWTSRCAATIAGCRECSSST